MAWLLVIGISAVVPFAPGPVAAAEPFPDVPVSHPFFDEIDWLVSEGITEGFSDGTFRPALAVSRQAFAAFLFRYEDPQGFVAPATATFSDVPETGGFFEAIEWLASTGITTGFDDGTFRPTQTISRQGIAAFLHRYNQPVDFTPPTTASFGDVPASSGFFEYIEWLASTEITTGYVDGTFRPGADVTRQSTAAFFFRYDELFGDEDEEPVIPPDPASVAPELLGTVEPTLYSTTRFLWAGTPKIQTGVDADTIDRDEAAAIRGRVVDTDGVAVPGAAVTVLDHPEYGATRSRADGWFDLVVNADRHHTVQIAAEAYPVVQRLGRVQPDQWTDLGEIVLTPFDTESTEIDTGAGEIQVHRATTSDDVDGERTATLVFPEGTEADMVMPDGSRVALDTMTVRATEYTVGERGPEAMPGDLPPGTDYTYAVELSVDEAVEAGATSVEFDEPVVNYTDNFVGFPAGVVVPTAYYDQQEGVWVPQPDGRVIDIVSETSGRADLDVTGDGTADTGAALTTLDITDDERSTIADLYEPGDSIWRVLIPHFSPWDHNWPNTCEGGCIMPPEFDDTGDDSTEEPCRKDGSIVQCQDQVLGERIDVTGTPYELNYWSDGARARASGRGIELRITDDAPPPDLVRIELTIGIAGQVHREVFAPAPNIVTEFLWDGLDIFGRPYPGSAFARVEINFVYPAGYAMVSSTVEGSSSFAAAMPPPLPSALPVAREGTNFDVGRFTTLRLDNRDVRDLGVGGWTFDVHHRLDPTIGQLVQGDGVTRDVSAFVDGYTVEHVAGDGEFGCDTPTCGDGGPVEDARVDPTRAMAVSPDGILYFFDAATTTIRRVDPDGTIDTAYGDGTDCAQSPVTACGTGGPASAIDLKWVLAMAYGPDGTLYLAEDGNGGDVDGPTIRAITPDGQVEHVAGSGAFCARPESYTDCGRSGPATEASWWDIDELAVTPDGVLWVNSDRLISRIENGWLTHAYGCIPEDCDEEESPSGIDGTYAPMNPRHLQAGPDGALYFLDLRGPVDIIAVRRIDPDTGVSTIISGSARNYACNNATSCRDNSPGHIAQHTSVRDLVVAPDGNVHVFELWVGDEGVTGVDRRIFPGGKLYRVAGDPDQRCTDYVPGACGDDGAASRASILIEPWGAAMSPDGSIYLDEFGAIRRVVPRDELTFPSTDGRQLFVFDVEGRHLETRDTATGAVLYTFDYDADGRLVGIADREGDLTTIARTPAGDPTSITGPFGQVTTLTTDGEGYLASAANPANDTHTMTYGEAGLLATFTDPVGNESRFTYDELGRLVRDENDAGGSLTLTRGALDTETDVGFRVTVTTEQNRSTIYDLVASRSLPITTRTVVEPSGATTVTVTDATAGPPVETTTYPNGRVVQVTYQDDPRWGRAAPVVDTFTETVPGLPTSTTTIDRQVVLDGSPAFGVASITETSTTNGRTTTYGYDGATRTETRTTPTGNVSTQVIDELGRVVTSSTDAALADVTVTYDSHGLVTAVAEGDRVTAYGYDSLGRVVSMTDAGGDETTFEYDAADRRIVTETPEGDRWQRGLDRNGRAITLTSPEGQVHDLAYNAVGNPTAWTGPDDGAETKEYTPDQEMVLETTGDDRTVARGFDDGGRPTTETYAEATATTGYLGTTSQIASVNWDQVTGPDQTLAVAYAGLWTTSMSFDGAAAGTFSTTWDANRWVSSVSIDSGAEDHTFGVAHDDDGDLTSYGPFTVDRSGPDRAIGSVADGVGSTDVAYDVYGATSGRSTVAGGVDAHAMAFVRDDLGRITQRTETTPSGSTVTVYGYDTSGRLVSSSVDGAPATTYAYDGNGNPVSGPRGAATFDASDRVTVVDGVTRTYDAAGFLTGRGDDTFTYSTRGELLSAEVGGDTSSYAYDGWGRRTSTTDGDGTTQHFYGNPVDPFQVTATRYADGTFEHYFYDDAGMLFALQRAGAIYYVGIDQVGSPVAVVDAAGTLVKQLTYDPWGNVVDDSAPAFHLALGFAGGLADDTTGLVRFGFRDYDPASGRWTAHDPSLFAGSHNLYTYAGNDPVNRHDPTGLMAACFGMTAYAGFGGGGQLCSSPEGVAVCVEAGFGAGGGASVSLGELPDTSATAGAEATAGCAGASVGVSGEYKIDKCGAEADACVTGGYGIGAAKGCVNGGFELTGAQADYDCKAEAKAYSKLCLQL